MLHAGSVSAGRTCACACVVYGHTDMCGMRTHKAPHAPAETLSHTSSSRDRLWLQPKSMHTQCPRLHYRLLTLTLLSDTLPPPCVSRDFWRHACRVSGGGRLSVFVGCSPLLAERHKGVTIRVQRGGRQREREKQSWKEQCKRGGEERRCGGMGRGREEETDRWNEDE